MVSIKREANRIFNPFLFEIDWKGKLRIAPLNIFHITETPF